MDDFAELFEIKLNEKLKQKPEILNEFKAALQISIDEKTWFFDPQALGPWIFSGKNENAACSISMTASNFEKLIKGKLNIPLAIALRKIKVSGNLTHLIPLRKLFE
jgi:putative sterol carrier protein